MVVSYYERRIVIGSRFQVPGLRFNGEFYELRELGREPVDYWRITRMVGRVYGLQFNGWLWGIDKTTGGNNKDG